MPLRSVVFSIVSTETATALPVTLARFIHALKYVEKDGVTGHDRVADSATKNDTRNGRRYCGSTGSSAGRFAKNATNDNNDDATSVTENELSIFYRAATSRAATRTSAVKLSLSQIQDARICKGRCSKALAQALLNLTK